MPQDLAIFNYEGTWNIRTTEIDGEAWFVAKDVADALGYRDTTNAIKSHCKGVAKHHLPTNGGTQEMSIISERDVYRLIMKSNLPTAERFENWVVSDVLPSIRKTGSYALMAGLPQTMPEALRMLASQIELTEEKDKLLLEYAPKVEFFDAVTDSKDAVDIGTVAKVLNCGIGRTRLFEFLRNNKILMGNNMPFQEMLDRGYFRVIETSYSKPDGSNHVNFKTLVLQKGISFIHRKLTESKQVAA
jgi:prophage antirepressor-like protein